MRPVKTPAGIGVGVGVGVGVAVRVEVGVGFNVAVSVGVGVDEGIGVGVRVDAGGIVGVGVRVGSSIDPDPQAETNRLVVIQINNAPFSFFAGIDCLLFFRACTDAFGSLPLAGDGAH